MQKSDTTYLEKAEAKQDQIDKKLDQFSKYQEMRVKAHKQNIPAPIVKDKDGNIHWLNRKQRRAQERRMKNGKKSISQKDQSSEAPEKAPETKEIAQGEKP